MTEKQTENLEKKIETKSFKNGNLPAKKNHFTASSNVVWGDSVEKLVSFVMNKISNTVSSSLGPYGSNTIIEDPSLNHQVSKDGYTILSRMMFKESIPRVITNMIKKIAENQVRFVGDGTTSSILISNNLYHSLKSFKKEYNIPACKLNKALDFMKAYLTLQIKQNTTLIEKTEDPIKTIRSIARVSANGSDEIANMICKAFDNDKNLNVTLHPERNTGEQNEVFFRSGYEIPSTYIDKSFVTNPDGIVAKYPNPMIMLFEGDITDKHMMFFGEFLNYLYGVNRPNKQEKPRPLIIIANKFQNFIKNEFFITNRKQNNLPIILITSNTNTKNSKDRFEDLGVYVKAEIFRLKDGEDLTLTENFNFTSILNRMGTCKEIICNERMTTFLEGAMDEMDKNKRLLEIDEEIKRVRSIEDEYDRNADFKFMEKRKILLSEGVVVIKIGGKTEIEKDNKFYLLDDAVLAVKSALSSGIVPGGNLTIPVIINKNYNNFVNDITNLKIFRNKEEVIAFINCFSNSFMKSFGKVLMNYYEKFDKVDDTKQKNWSILGLVKSLVENEYIINIENFNQFDTKFDITQQGYEKLSETTIINPALTEIEILNSSLSIVELLVNTNQYMTMSFFD